MVRVLRNGTTCRTGPIVKNSKTQNGSKTQDTSKRKGPRSDFTGKLSHLPSPKSKNQSITRYFQAIDLQTNDSNCCNGEFDEGDDVPQENKYSRIDLSRVSPVHRSPADCDITDNPCHAITQNITSSPSTPHRIEQIERPSLCSQLQVNDATSKRAPRTKRRLKTNTSSNTQREFLNNNNKTVTEPTTVTNHKLTEYFPVRRSERKTKQTVLEERQKHLEEAIKEEVEDGLEIHNFEGKGRGVITTRLFKRGDYVVEYRGELIDMTEAKRREQMYANDQNTGCYMYYFKHRNQQYCVDATAESGYLGRLVNHSRNGNLMTRTVVISGQPHLVLIAKEDIQSGVELTYDYGDRSKESLRYHPWLAS